MVLGIDIGSSALSAVLLDPRGRIADTFYETHSGQVGAALQKLSATLPPNLQSRLALTSSSRLDLPGIETTDIQTALIRASQFMEKSPDYILHVGAEKFYLIKRGPDGKYESSRTNSSCAAGTGSFLDQQYRRLQIPSIEEFCSMAENNKGDVPEIASRCSVFAKTDLIHAQQEGYSQEAICDGLCKGLARSIADTLFHDFVAVEQILFTGGVSRNQVVSKYLEEMLGAGFSVHPQSHIFGALGAGLRALDLEMNPEKRLEDLIDHYSKPINQREYFYQAFQPALTSYPDFSESESRVQASKIKDFTSDLQVEVFQDFGEIKPESIYIGMDIGSTSTKAVISTIDNVPLLGYYTYTSGKPIEAVFCILEALDQYMRDYTWYPDILGVGTTGSGRKLVGKILNADLIVDEITAHARAAVHLDPGIDTIIEIGGQDAKFTVLNRGEVVFSQMNAVCAAGTGSFIEEQAKKLGVPLDDYEDRVMNQRSPLTSDRCTVFMERDLNYLINEGYAIEELLMAVLYSVRENYLRKVAIEGMIGKRICFQGATARNKALVGVFEQRLGQEIHVSRLCHLTGALGVSLIMKKDRISSTNFRGISIYKEHVPVRTEICDLCNNHCKLTIANIKEEEIAYGFLCGRDYKTPKYKAMEGAGFDLLKERRKTFSLPPASGKLTTTVLGIPSALHMYEESWFWKHFFALLRIRTVFSNPGKTHLRDGKHLAGAEFCAPIDSMYGHVKDLAKKADYIFLPVFIESREQSRSGERNYCYYTQFSPSIVSQIEDSNLVDRFIIPEMDFSRSPRVYIKALFQSLKIAFENEISYPDVSRAWEEAENRFRKVSREWRNRYITEFQPGEGVSVALLGRPYVILSPELNKSIPDYFLQREIKCFSQGMLPAGIQRSETTEEILNKVPWHFAANILGSAEYIARTPGLYPVLVTAFKCAPDSFIIEYFKNILEAFNKPYLILQIDEHDSSVGYETRIEAALRSFENHAGSVDISGLEDVSKKDSYAETAGHAGKISSHLTKKIPNILPVLENKIDGKTVLIPSWDRYSQRLLVALLRRKGIDARLLEPDEMGMRKSMAHNSGQCIPINILAQDFIDYVEKYDLDPSQTLLWTAKNWLTCNFRMYPEYLKSLLENQGNGMEKAGVYLGSLSNLDISMHTSAQSYLVYMLGGLIRKMGCVTRPYELEEGTTDRIIESSLKVLENAFLGEGNLELAVGDMARMFNGIKTLRNEPKPEVGIFGDFYVRDHEIMNQDLIHFIEKAGGIVVTTPYHDYIKITVNSILRRARKRGDYFTATVPKIMLSLMNVLDRKYYRQLESIIGIKEKINAESLEKHLDAFNVKPYHSGESYDNLLKIFHILEYHPELSLFVQTNPAFCCPALITEAMTQRIKSITGIPIVTVTYDGTSESKNEIILPYLVAAT
ncbi:acyl-CoA dehydratase activase [Bacteroidota bacterium]